MSELAKRIIMGIIMVAIVLVAIIYLPQTYFYIAVGVIIFVMSMEWIRLITSNKVIICFYGLVLIAAIVALWWVQRLHYFPISCVVVDLMACIVGIIQLFVFANHPSSAFVQNKSLRIILSLIILISAQYFLTDLRWHGNLWIVYVIALVAMFDTGAYFIGRACGKHHWQKN